MRRRSSRRFSPLAVTCRTWHTQRFADILPGSRRPRCILTGMAESGRSVRQIAGARDIDGALQAGVRLGVILVRRVGRSPAVSAVVQRASGIGVRVREVSTEVLRRMSDRHPPAEVLALVGRNPEARLDELLAGAGVVWLLAGVTYPSNAGMAIRTAEVSGADGIVIDTDFNAAARRFALRISVRSDWYMPVLWHDAKTVLDAAAAAGRQTIGIEHVGTEALWEIDLRGRALLVVGGEAHGIPAAVLSRCERVVRIPMAGFIPSYNVQAAIAATAIERLRQCQSR